MSKEKVKMAKRRKTKESKKSKFLLYTAWSLALVALILASLIVGFYLGEQSAAAKIAQQKSEKEAQRLAVLQKLEEKSKLEKKHEDVNQKLKEVLQKESHKREQYEYTTASHELDQSANEQLHKEHKREVVKSVTRPKLAIIIDDVGTRSQVNAIKSLELPLTMSFLPPSSARPNTPRLAAKEKNYMVHLPMEAQNFTAEEPYTLRVSDSQKTISERISEIKKLFPNAKYINNHTGSKFTADERAMNRLIGALSANELFFVDSRTTAQTKAPKVLKNFGLSYLARDVFLDHHMDKPYILGQIKEAVRVAKSHGSAIAIGHPHKNTLQALYESKQILKDVEIVYIEDIY